MYISPLLTFEYYLKNVCSRVKNKVAILINTLFIIFDVIIGLYTEIIIIAVLISQNVLDVLNIWYK